MYSILLVSVLMALTNAGAIFSNTTLKNGGQHWGVIVAGSNGWYNYRHQADACHAYQILKKHGVPESNIITMMYGDIAFNPENPTKGIIINHPNGKDVYKGVVIDYKGRDVTPDNFLNILQGKKKEMEGIGSGRVLESGPNDHVFVNFVDHGAPGLIAFPTDELHARPLMKAIRKMHMKKMYAQMVIYIEACESGSMFKNLLPDNINVFATTAANSKESSYAIYFDKKRQTYLGDVYSVKWMENSDTTNMNLETLAKQFALVKRETNTSHVQEFGELSIADDPVGDFQGNTQNPENIYYPYVEFDGVPSPDVELHLLYHKLTTAVDEELTALKDKLSDLLQYRDMIGVEMKHIVAMIVNNDHKLVDQIISTRSEDFNFPCYEAAVHYYSATCRKLSAHSYALRHLYALQNLCNTEGMTLPGIYSAMRKVCQE